MSLKDDVVSLPVARELERARFGVEGDNCFIRIKEIYKNNKTPFGEWREWKLSRYSNGAEKWFCQKDKRELIKTYTLTETLRELPDKIKHDKRWRLEKDFISYMQWEWARDAIHNGGCLKKIYPIEIDDKTNPATAAAKLWLWCKENGYIGGEK
jgi:hypothetical protein